MKRTLSRRRIAVNIIAGVAFAITVILACALAPDAPVAGILR